MKTIIKAFKTIICRYFKQLNCEHDWRKKGFGTMNTQWFTSTAKRCCKCGKIEYNYNELYKSKN